MKYSFSTHNFNVMSWKREGRCLCKQSFPHKSKPTNLMADEFGKEQGMLCEHTLLKCFPARGRELEKFCGLCFPLWLQCVF